MNVSPMVVSAVASRKKIMEQNFARIQESMETTEPPTAAAGKSPELGNEKGIGEWKFEVPRVQMMKPLQDGFVSGILRNAFFLKNA
jgi:hypothetical protein